ncbi:MAG: hypothetical protein OHM77_12680 [Candidatus Nitricoxidivorans perseverans]|uniref:Uncharacterized protein n=1 Tax=Candidatus Nitricoxidivorans perseverans TaxID=2975601 RepID=A0AA49IXY8_9PROT|nr:MAG: hypothetical protein OHM77_12680 [Candidatus Nitricoxidivorans perseverans]
MAESIRSSTSSPELQSALAWLGAPPAEDPLRDLVPLRNHLAEGADAGLPPLRWLKVLELFQARANAIDDALRPLLLDATLPLPRHLRTVAQGLVWVHGALAEGYLRVAREADPTKLTLPRRTLPALCAEALAGLSRQYEVALLVSAPAPANLWSHVQAAFHLLNGAFPPHAILTPDIAAADRALKSVLALAAAQPETFAAREIDFLADYLRGAALAVEVRTAAPEPMADWHWLEESRDLPPVAAGRRLPPPDGHVLYFSCTALGNRVREQIGRLISGERPETLGIPPMAAAGDYRNALARAGARWSSPQKRQFHRRRQNQRVQVCAHLGTLWRQLHGDAGAASGEAGMQITNWMVLNESPGGYAMMHVSGSIAGLVAGAALGLRMVSGQPWSICLVRWARSDNPEHVELGLELIAPSAEAVRIVWPGRDAGAAPTTALLLPPLPRIDRGEALLAARGHYSAGRFTLISEGGGKLQLTECMSQNLALQTACVEVFEFERDFSPR